MNNNKYVVGFIFTFDMTEVLLIKKNRPHWMQNLYNGIGGHINEDESDIYAMYREGEEEAGVGDDRIIWSEFALLKGKNNDGQDFSVRCYLAKLMDKSYIKQMTDEELFWIKVSDIQNIPHIRNLEWLIPSAIVAATQNTRQYLTCEYF